MLALFFLVNAHYLHQKWVCVLGKCQFGCLRFPQKFGKMNFILKAGLTETSDIRSPLSPPPPYLVQISIFIFLVEGIIVKVSDPALWGLLWNPLQEPQGSEDPVFKWLKQLQLWIEMIFISIPFSYSYIYIPQHSSTPFLHGPLCPCLIPDPRSDALDWLRC